jgi:hypothetical protein
MTYDTNPASGSSDSANSDRTGEHGASMLPSRRGLRVPETALNRPDLVWFVLTYAAGTAGHLPQWLAASSVVCETTRAGDRMLAFYLDVPWAGPGLLVTRVPAGAVEEVSMHADSVEAALAADFAWAREHWGLTRWDEGDLYVPAGLG